MFRMKNLSLEGLLSRVTDQIWIVELPSRHYDVIKHFLCLSGCFQILHNDLEFLSFVIEGHVLNPSLELDVLFKFVMVHKAVDVSVYVVHARIKSLSVLVDKPLI